MPHMKRILPYLGLRHCRLTDKSFISNPVVLMQMLLKSMDKPTQLIPQISPDSKSWAVRVTVVEDIPPITCANDRYVMTDDEVNEVVGPVYGRDVRVFCPINADINTCVPKLHSTSRLIISTPLYDAPFCQKRLATQLSEL